MALIKLIQEVIIVKFGLETMLVTIQQASQKLSVNYMVVDLDKLKLCKQVSSLTSEDKEYLLKVVLCGMQCLLKHIKRQIC